MIDGIPIVGIVRLPFHGTIGLSQWAVHLPGLCIAHNLAFPVSHRRSTAPISVLLGNDRASDALADRCTADGLQVFRVSGAGYKLWLLINQMVDAWIVPTATVYNWDTCAGHVLLKAAHVATGGDLLTLSPIDATFRPHDYRLTDANKNHSTSADSGIAALIAYRDSALIPILKQKLSLNLNKCE